jgi:S-adenosylmethionine/arginine decarboxylase-like enzyme
MLAYRYMGFDVSTCGKKVQAQAANAVVDILEY